MVTMIDKRDRAALFQRRLSQAMAVKGATRSGLARAIGADRSTLSQLLAPDSTRLPNAQLVAACAAELGVSCDWLLGLSERPEQASDLLAASIALTRAERAMVDDQIIAWHREAAGYKLRFVPARLPDFLKTPAMLRWEYAPHLGRSTDEAIAASGAQLDWMRQSRSDYEIAMPLFELSSFVSGAGYYEDLPDEIRRAQIAHFLTLHDQLYPRLRIFLFDGRELHSAAITIFGPLMAVLYVGQHYMAFRDIERVDAMTGHFDQLVRKARVSARSFSQHLNGLAASFDALGGPRAAGGEHLVTAEERTDRGAGA